MVFTVDAPVEPRRGRNRMADKCLTCGHDPYEPLPGDYKSEHLVIAEQNHEIQRLRQALEFYANPDNWETDMKLHRDRQRAECKILNFESTPGGWFVAREALKDALDGGGK